MKDLIKVSNQEISDLIKVNPDSGIIKVLKKWKSQRNLRDYHTTLELIAAELGFSILMDYEENGWIPFFDFKPNNLLDERVGSFTLVESPIKSIERCQRFLTKETIYRLMKVYNLEYILER